jgi:hypothetical protein
MYATTRYNFVRLKAMHKISPLEELVEGDLPPSSSQRLTGMLLNNHKYRALCPSISQYVDQLLQDIL